MQADSYWTLDTSLFTGQFRYFSAGPVLVRGKAHQESERFSLSPGERDREPVKQLAGTRQYIHLKPFVLVPDMILTIAYRQRQDLAALLVKCSPLKSAARKK
jgi:hypothetical protein